MGDNNGQFLSAAEHGQARLSQQLAGGFDLFVMRYSIIPLIHYIV